MSQGCDLACQTKIILNGGNIVGIAEANHTAVKRMKPDDLDKLDGEKIIKLLNRMEDDAVEVQKLLVQSVGYTGEKGKMLNG